MGGLPILLVFRGAPPAGLVSALESAGLLHRAATPKDAADSVNDGWADVVVCGRAPGWAAMVARVATAGGAAVLWGRAPEGPEPRALGAARVDATQDPEEALRLISEARGRIAARARTLDGDELRDRVESAERVSRFAQSIALQGDLPRVVAETVARTRDLCDADGASLLLVDPQTGELTFDVVSGGAGDRIRRMRLPPGQGIAGHVARTAEPVRVAEVRTSPWFDPACDEASGFVTGSVIAAPLLLGGDLIGVLEAVRGASRPPFQEPHLRRLVELAPHVGIAVHNAEINARLREAQALVMRDNAELERRIAERTEQLSRGKREWEATFDAISEPIAVQDGFVVRRANAAWARRAGVPITAVPGRTCHELLAGRASPCEGCPLASGGELSAQVQLRGGGIFRLAGFRMPGDDGRVVLHYRDVTRQTVLEEQLRQSERMAALGQLASGAAHEINNPLGFVVSNLRNLGEAFEALAEGAGAARKAAEALREGRGEDAARLLEAAAELPEELVADGRDMVEESLQGARRVAEIVRGLRELSRQTVSGVAAAPVNAAVARAVRAQFGEDAPAVVLELGDEAPAVVDPLQLDQALGHVLRNARQAISGGQRVHVRTRAAADEVWIEVRDEGCGIPREHLRRVFEPFFTTRGVGGGIGLGLTATWGIVRRHGGDVEIASEPGSGTVVTLRLPRAPAPASPPALAS